MKYIIGMQAVGLLLTALVACGDSHESWDGTPVRELFAHSELIG